MGSVGLLYVGAVLIINGCMLLGWVESRSAAPLNLFVGTLQVVTPTYLIFTANGDQDVILAASGLYLFGFTYLYVGLNLLAGFDSSGLGYFSGFVAVSALVYSGLNFGRLKDNGFGVIWLDWALLWALFFIVLGLKVESLTRFTGAVALVEGVVTGAVPAFLLLTGKWTQNADTAGVTLAIFSVVVFGVLFLRLRRPGEPSVPSQATSREPASRPAQTAAPR